jgi:hypothetical protein
MNMEVTPANKKVLNGIHSVMSRLKMGDDGEPQMYFMRDSVLEPDPILQEAMQPWKTEDEFDGYEWENAQKKETPRKVNDDGMDCNRYLSVFLDEETGSWTRGMKLN